MYLSVIKEARLDVVPKDPHHWLNRALTINMITAATFLILLLYKYVLRILT